MQEVDKSKLTIIILSIVFALSLSVTITLAAFSAHKTGDVTLTFADGLTMTVTPRGNSGRIAITGGGVDDYTFSYTAQNNLAYNPLYDGFYVTLNKSGWAALRIEFLETTSGSDVAPAGAFQKTATSEFTFYPTGTRNYWVTWFQLNSTDFDIVASNNILTATSKTALSTDTATIAINMWSLKTKGTGSQANYVDDLGGRAFKYNFTVKAKTDAAPTF